MRLPKLYSRKVKLPTTLAQFDALVDTLVSKYKFQDKHHTAGILSVAIRHLPVDQAYSTLDYFYQYISKNLANYVANYRGQTLQHESQIDHLVGILTSNPEDTEARDKLQLAANDGSEYAKKALSKLNPAQDPLSPVPLEPLRFN